MVRLSLGTALAIALGVLAATPGNAGAPFSRSDKNRDGFVSYAEAQRTMPKLPEVHFLKCDRNGDGVLDKKEYLCLTSIYDAMYRRR